MPCWPWEAQGGAILSSCWHQDGGSQELERMLRARNGLAVRCSGFGLSVSGLLVGLSLSLKPATMKTQAHLCLVVLETPKCQQLLLTMPSLMLTLTLRVPVNLSEDLGTIPVLLMNLMCARISVDAKTSLFLVSASHLAVGKDHFSITHSHRPGVLTKCVGGMNLTL